MGRTVTTSWPTRGKALTFRNRMYGFKNALELRYKDLLKRSDPMSENQLERVKEYLTYAECIHVTVDARNPEFPTGVTVAIVMHKDKSPYAKILRDAIDSAEPDPDMEADILASIEKFKEMQK